MTQNTISVHRALSRLKVLDAQIKAASTKPFIALTKGDKRLVMTDALRTQKAEDLSGILKSNLQSVNDMIAERAKIKAAIVASNAVTQVTIGGVTMPVAVALEYKESIGYEQNLLNQLRSQFNLSNMLFQKASEALEQEISQNISVLLSRDNNAKPSEEQANVIRNTTEARLKPEFVDPNNILECIEALSKKIDDFTSEVDAVLSESNARTVISV